MPPAAQLTGSAAGAIFLGDRTRSVTGLGDAPIVIEAGGRQVFKPGDMVHLRPAKDAFLAL